MQLVNILLTIGLIILILGVAVLSICAVIAAPRSKKCSLVNHNQPKLQERRKNSSCDFPITCKDGTMVYFDRRLQI